MMCTRVVLCVCCIIKPCVCVCVILRRAWVTYTNNAVLFSAKAVFPPPRHHVPCSYIPLHVCLYRVSYVSESMASYTRRGDAQQQGHCYRYGGKHTCVERECVLTTTRMCVCYLLFLQCTVAYQSSTHNQGVPHCMCVQDRCPQN